MALLRFLPVLILLLSMQKLIKTQKPPPTCDGYNQDVIYQSPSFTYLPQDYNLKQAQNPNPILHPISIMLQTGSNSQFITNQQMEIFRKMFKIVSYFYSKIIFVQKIAPRSQTLYHGDKCRQYFDIPSKYSTQGFDPDQTDLVIFLSFNLKNNRCSSVLSCLVERRPIYGGIIYQAAQLQIYSNQQFQKNLALLTHRFMHILGFNPAFLTFNADNQNWLDTQINTLETYYFKNSSTSQKLKRNQVIQRALFNPSNNMYASIITTNVKKFIKDTFNCAFDVGAPLDTNLVHWNRYVFKHDFMAADYNKKKNDWKYYELTFHFLKDTGFYQAIDLQITDKLHYNWPLFDSCNYLLLPRSIGSSNINFNFFYDRWGIQQVFIFTILSGGSIQANQQEKSCSDYFYTKKALQFQIERQYPYFCLAAQCYTNTTNGKRKIRMIMNGYTFEGCEDGKTTQYIEFLDLNVKCPLDMNSFCETKTCPNWCSSQGICVNGKCIVPNQNELSQQQQKPSFSVCNDNSTALCPLGCQSCTCENISSVNCITTVQGYSKITDQGNPFIIYKIRTCPFGCQDCYNNQNTCNDCFDNYYWISGRQSCLKCQSSCSACSYTGIKGKTGCINCLEGHYINNFDYCQSCEILKCLTCSNSRVKTCQKCIDGYAPNKQKSKCVPCLIGCSKCSQSNFLVCQGCRSGYYLQKNPSDGFYCPSCQVGCQTCTSQVCQNCFQGWVKDASNKCVKECLSPCLTCSSNDVSQCLSCMQGFYILKKGKCQPQISCNENQTCANCPQGFIRANNSIKCIKCLKQNCGQCEFDPQYCTKCQVGYYLNFQDGCTLCPAQCKTCFQQDVCHLCSDGYSHPKNIDGSRQKQSCILCLENCLLCPSSPEECMVCKSGYYKLGWKCVPERFINYTVTLDYPGTVQQFIQLGEYELVQNEIKSKFSLGATSDSSLISLSQGSIIISAQIGNSNGQLSQQCLLFYEISQSLSSGATIRGYRVVSTLIVPRNSTCYQYPFTSVRIETVQTGVPIGVVIAIIVTVVVLMIIFTALFIRYMLLRTEEIILKYEKIKSKQQYQSTSIISQVKQAI